MSSYAERLNAAQGVQEAMTVLAEGIDALLERLGEQPAAPDHDRWTAWGTSKPAGAAEQLAAAHANIAQRHAEIQAVKDALVTATGDEHRALEARLRLLEDTGQVPEPAVDEGTRIDVDGELIGFPVADRFRQAKRLEWSIANSLETFQSHGNTLTAVEMATAFAKGGPMWLYLYDRDAIMQMPDGWKRELVADIEADSPAQAQEIARDILKDLSADGSRETVVGALGA